MNLIIGIGNEHRGDDAIGLIVARTLRKRLTDQGISGTLAIHESDGDPAVLLDLWEAAETVIVVDAVVSGREPGTVITLNATCDKLPREWFSSVSTHDFGIAQAVELGKILDRMPHRLWIVGVEAAKFEPGPEMSEGAMASVEKAVDSVFGFLSP